MDAFTLCIVWIDTSMEPIGSWRHDLGERPRTREVKRARAAVWKKGAGEDDMDKARAYAKREGGVVVVVSESEPDPIGYAKSLHILTRWASAVT